MELERGSVSLSPRSEHFVSQVVIDGDDTTVICSCGQSFEPKSKKKGESAEQSARKEYDKHYEKVMK